MPENQGDQTDNDETLISPEKLKKLHILKDTVLQFGDKNITIYLNRNGGEQCSTGIDIKIDGSENSEFDIHIDVCQKESINSTQEVEEETSEDNQQPENIILSPEVIYEVEEENGEITDTLSDIPIFSLPQNDFDEEFYESYYPSVQPSDSPSETDTPVEASTPVDQENKEETETHNTPPFTNVQEMESESEEETPLLPLIPIPYIPNIPALIEEEGEIPETYFPIPPIWEEPIVIADPVADNSTADQEENYEEDDIIVNTPVQTTSNASSPSNNDSLPVKADSPATEQEDSESNSTSIIPSNSTPTQDSNKTETSSSPSTSPKVQSPGVNSNSSSDNETRTSCNCTHSEENACNCCPRDVNADINITYNYTFNIGDESDSIFASLEDIVKLLASSNNGSSFKSAAGNIYNEEEMLELLKNPDFEVIFLKDLEILILPVQKVGNSTKIDYESIIPVEKFSNGSNVTVRELQQILNQTSKTVQFADGINSKDFNPSHSKCDNKTSDYAIYFIEPSGVEITRLKLNQLLIDASIQVFYLPDGAHVQLSKINNQEDTSES